MTVVTDNIPLLDALTADEAKAEVLYLPTPYWAGYAARIIAELRSSGLSFFRRNDNVLKGFGQSGSARPSLPVSAWKRTIWQATAAAPVVRLIVSEYERLVRALSQHLTTAEINLAREVLDKLALRHPELKIPDGTTNGDATDGFAWRGKQVSAHFVRFLVRASCFYETVDPKSVTSILEIGPGMGFATLAHFALNTNLRTAINIDIVPTIYISGQFLASVPGVKVVNYLHLRDQERITIEPTAGFTVYSLPPWSLPKIDASLDYGFNAYSFQEMEPNVVGHYIDQIARLCGKGAMVQNSLLGVPEGASPQRQPVTTAFARERFLGRYALCDDIANNGVRNYEGAESGAVLLFRDSRD